MTSEARKIAARLEAVQRQLFTLPPCPARVDLAAFIASGKRLVAKAELERQEQPK